MPVDIKCIRESAASLRELVVTKSKERPIFYHLLRRYGNEGLVALRPSRKKGVGAFMCMPADLELCLRLDQWDQDFLKLSNELQNVGQRVEEVCSDLGDALVARHRLTALAHFLGVQSVDYRGENSIQQGQMPDLAKCDSLTRFVIRHVFQEGQIMALPAAPSASLLRRAMGQTLGQIDWPQEAASVLLDLRKCLRYMQTLITDAITLKRNVVPVDCVCCFLLIEPIGILERPKALLWESALGRALQGWLGNRIVGGEYTSNDPMTPFDPAFSMDPEFRVFRPGSGQTHKPGSHRDGRGHR